MVQSPPNQSSWGRAKQDTGSAQKTARFMWGGEGVLAVAGGAWLTALANPNAPVWEIVGRAVIGGIGGLITAVLIILAWNLFRAPYKQRNEAREQILELEAGNVNIFDAEWQHKSISIFVAKRENGEWIGGSGWYWASSINPY